ncbi:MAG: tRNA uridine(34) 5-carboxymethylaminomethyl modification radical SAM/GNAT enzyme Elp3 [Gemmatimonadetes bacterium]|nr:tRNA uridine(34) 5-carboxymethylaminomethyl modification radical SAM/GNAT enzyme Elp3 [Gemmatimonadota bacterium]
MDRERHREFESFEPRAYENELASILRAVGALPEVDSRSLDKILRANPKDGKGFFSRSELIAGVRALGDRHDFGLGERQLIGRLLRKPTRTWSGVAPVTVLTEPHPCPGKCVFCPSDEGMPKSYLASEPGAQRAVANSFDPFRQTWNRVVALHRLGHAVDKVELLILGGTWTAYPQAYRVWFVRRCIDALNEVGDSRWDVRRGGDDGGAEWVAGAGDADWKRLVATQDRNRRARCRCVGLVVETRPDHVDEESVVRMRRLGATKVQLGIQSLSDDILRRNERGHSVEQSRRAVRLLRRAGFKIHLHWMPNLVGATPESDTEDFGRLFGDESIRPDELKIYPCSLVRGTELMRLHSRGDWRPYSHEELMAVLVHALANTPEYCRVSRVVRDIPGNEIVAGSTVTNLRQELDRRLIELGVETREIRGREIRGGVYDARSIRRERSFYGADACEEHFLQLTSDDGRLLAFLRMSLPWERGFIEELGGAAIVREVHVYGAAARLHENDGAKAQHSGLGRRLVEWAVKIARAEGYERLAVISAVGTKEYYEKLGFEDGVLYQHWGRGG